MNYDDFESSFTKENRKLKISLAITLGVCAAVVVMLVFQRNYFLYKGGPIFEERPLAEEICRSGFESLAEGGPNPHLVNKNLIKIAQSENFIIPIEKIYQVQSLEVGACKIILRSEGKLVAYKITLDGRVSNPFHYKLIQIDEIAPKEKI
jgi:hypothetical protein